MSANKIDENPKMRVADAKFCWIFSHVENCVRHDNLEQRRLCADREFNSFVNCIDKHAPFGNV